MYYMQLYEVVKMNLDTEHIKCSIILFYGHLRSIF